ncbi:MAG: phosphate ABC transporter permease subunit PstC [Chloroflexi bacterium]|nr:phosphate ABC transporter permease subunit PstC [Chloroflexota bacterium]
MRRDADLAAALRKRPRVGEMIIRYVLLFCGLVSIFTTVGIVIVNTTTAIEFFTVDEVSPIDFFTNTVWRPAAYNPDATYNPGLIPIGVLPLLYATLFTSFIALIVAVPLGLGSAIYLAEYAPERVRNTLKPILEILAGIPTVVLGYFALTFMTPLLQAIPGLNVQIFNMAAPGLVMGVMIIPTISSMSEDAISSVPRELREASYGLGATRFESITKVVLPAALSGLVAAFILGLARAVGETMIVALAAGSAPADLLNNFLNPFVAGETMTGHIARITGGDLPYDSIQYRSLFAIGLTLFVSTLALNLISQWVSRRFREAYE